MSTDAASPNVDVTINGKDDVPDGHFLSYSVERDMYQADMASVMLANQSDLYSASVEVGQELEIKVGDSKTSVFKGEIIGIEPIYKGGDKSKVILRAMNKLHRLLRKRKSVTFTNKTDQQILNQVVGDAGLSLDWKHEKTITYKHVYQHNLTDLEFLRTRAARMGCHVWCVDKQVFVKQPELQEKEIATLNVDEASDTASLRCFRPRLSSAAVVNKVTCKGWNPETKELITGDATVQGSKLGSTTSVAGSGPFGNEETFTCDHPIWDKEEAVALAKARLQAAALTYITGEAEVNGDPKLDIGKVVKIVANSGKPDPFNGKYYIMGLTHRHQASHAKDDSAYITILRLARDAQKE